MAIPGFSWIIPFAIGPLAAGLVMDNLDPRWVWFAGGILSAIATIGFYVLHKIASSRKKSIPQVSSLTID
jgi:MFS family permease